MIKTLCALLIFALAVIPSSAYANFAVLTFDDGPRKEILIDEGLLDLLDREGIKATFFVQGWQADKYPELIKEIVRRGHIVANHTYGHASLCERIVLADPASAATIRKLKPQERDRVLAKFCGPANWFDILSKKFPAEVIKNGKNSFLADAERGSQAIEKILGYRPLFFRPPKWSLTPEIYCALTEDGNYIVQTIPYPGIGIKFCPKTKEAVRGQQAPSSGQQDTQDAKKLRREHILRDVNTEDYSFYTGDPVQVPRAIENLTGNVLRIIGEREREDLSVHVLVFHETKVTVRALRSVIKALRAKGYLFRNLPFVYGV